MDESKRREMEASGYIVWLDYGSEGWGAEWFSNETEVIDYIQSGVPQPFIVTRPVRLNLIPGITR